MSTTLQRLREAHKSARLEQDHTLLTILTTILGEAQIVGKSAGNRESTEEEVLKVLRRFEGSLVDNMVIFTERKLEQALDDAEIELLVIRQFLPAKISDDQLTADIISIMTEKNLPKEPRSQGVLSKELKARYGDQYDGKQFSGVFKTVMG